MSDSLLSSIFAFRAQDSHLAAYTVALAVIAASVFWFLLYGGPLGSIPGPLIARISPLWLVYHSRKGDMHRATIDLHKRFGPVVRTAPNELSISDLDAIKKIYGYARSGFGKAHWYLVWQGKRKFDLFAERNEKIHSSQRRLVNRVYAMDALKEGESYVDNAVSAYLERLKAKAGQKIDMALWNQLFAFDVIGEVTFSSRFGYMDVGKDDGAFAQIDRTLHSAAWLGQVPALYRLDQWLTPYIGRHLGMAVRHGSLREFAAKEVDARMARVSGHRDMLNKLKAVHEARPEDFDEAAILSMVSSNVNAGSDTTAVSLSSVLYHLCKFPEARERLLAEIEDRRRKGLIGEIILTDTALKMPYLQACIQEGLRLHPAVGMALPRVTPPQGFEVQGRYIPGGTVVGANAWVIHRNQQIYGRDVEVFRPERWLEGDRGDMDRFFMAFGAGSRTCLGRNLSWMEMSKVIPMLLLKFDLQLANPAADWEEDYHWFVKQKRFDVVLQPRKTAQ